MTDKYKYKYEFVCTTDDDIFTTYNLYEFRLYVHNMDIRKYDLHVNKRLFITDDIDSIIDIIYITELSQYDVLNKESQQFWLSLPEKIDSLEQSVHTLLSNTNIPI
jgi:hypothetical protein